MVRRRYATIGPPRLRTRCAAFSRCGGYEAERSALFLGCRAPKIVGLPGQPLVVERFLGGDAGAGGVGLQLPLATEARADGRDVAAALEQRPRDPRPLVDVRSE